MEELAAHDTGRLVIAGVDGTVTHSDAKKIAIKDDKGKVLYDGRTFFALKGAENVGLLFRLKSLDKNTTKRRVVGGKSYNVVY